MSDRVDGQLVADRRRWRRARPRRGSSAEPRRPPPPASWRRLRGRACPVAALAQPELASTARSAPRRQRSRADEHGRGRRAAGGEARGADRCARRRTRAGPRRAAARLQPAATPAARKPAGSPASGRVAHVRGRGTQRERKNGSALSRRALRSLGLEPNIRLRFCDRLRGGALPEVVDRGEHEHLAGVRVGRREHPAVVVSRTSRVPGGRSATSTNGSSA